MAAPRLFVVVSTGQNVANLPPLLEQAERGDQVLWIESELARQKTWSQGARQVLLRHGLTVLPSVDVGQVNDPSQVVAACKEIVGQWRDKTSRPYLVLNGGNKLTPVGLLRGWQDLNPVLLYGDDQKAAFWLFANGVEHPPSIHPYERHRLDLIDVLDVSGHVVQNSQEAEKFWPGPVPPDVLEEPYGADPTYTHDLHHQHYQCANAPPSGEWPSFDYLARILPARLEKWKRSLPPLAPPATRDINNDGLFKSIYHSVVNLGEDAARAQSRGSIPRPVAAIGPAFARAVVRRVHAWLDATRHPAVQSAWRNVDVARKDQLGRNRANLDVLLVLKNGILWHLECKSFTAEAKDLDARLLNLQQAGSLRAEMAVCGPLLTDCTKSPWFKDQHDLKVKIDDLGRLDFLPFTLPNQPGSYPDPSNSAGTILCPTLEHRLKDRLDRYCL